MFSSLKSEFRVVLPPPGGRPLRVHPQQPPLASPPRPEGADGAAPLAAVPPLARVDFSHHDVPPVRRFQVRNMVEGRSTLNCR